MASGDLQREREAIRPLVSLSDPGDALTVYYALYHAPALTRLFVHRGGSGGVDGFLAVCTTGADLFRPLVVMRAQSDEVLRALLHTHLVPGRPYHFVTPLFYASILEEEIERDEEHVGQVLELDVRSFEPIINVLVVQAPAADGGLRFEIRSKGKVMAAAGVNWRSPHFAEIYVYAEPEVRGRGWGKSVAAACTSALLAEGVRPLYVVADADEVSSALAAGLGYRDTGRREYIAAGQMPYAFR